MFSSTVDGSSGSGGYHDRKMNSAGGLSGSTGNVPNAGVAVQQPVTMKNKWMKAFKSVKKDDSKSSPGMAQVVEGIR